MQERKSLWKPSEEFKSQSNLRSYENWLHDQKGLSFESYEELWRWSVDNVEEFWESLWHYFDIKQYQGYHQVLSGSQMPGYRWFEGATLNYAEHIFRNKSDHRPALIFQSEQGEPAYISWKKLEDDVSAVQAFLVDQGIKKGDCVAAYLPNIPEAITAFLAVNSIGAVWSCCSPDFGVNTVIDRFTQIKPKLLIASNGYHYNGKFFDRTKEVKAINQSLDAVRCTVLVSVSDVTTAYTDPGWSDWNDVLTKSYGQNLSFEAVPFSHPIWVLYSSGTTGRPKAITHSHGGVLLEHLKYMAFHNDVHPGENFFWFTTTGWMMWNFLQGSLLMGATAVLYDGSPGYQSLNTLWAVAEKLPIHHFGTSAPFLTACMKRDLNPGMEFDLSGLRSIGSTGAPLPAEAFEWVYQSVSDQVWLCSMSGGTDVCTAFVGGIPYKPVYVGAIQGRALGCGLIASDDQGNEIKNDLGEMVIPNPMPSMPVFFWGDDNNERYQHSYFDKFPGKWCHGDWVKIFEDGSLIIQGRSDATLNRKGIRIGTAEIYAALDSLEEISDSMVLNLEKESGDDIMPLFVLMSEAYDLTPELEKKIVETLKTKCSPRHIPDLIIRVDDIPYTLSGKKMEVPVKKILLGMDSDKSMNKDAVRNPDSIEWFKSFAVGFRDEFLSNE